MNPERVFLFWGARGGPIVAGRTAGEEGGIREAEVWGGRGDGGGRMEGREDGTQTMAKGRVNVKLILDFVVLLIHFVHIPPKVTLSGFKRLNQVP